MPYGTLEDASKLRSDFEGFQTPRFFFSSSVAIAVLDSFNDDEKAMALGDGLYPDAHIASGALTPEKKMHESARMGTASVVIRRCR